MCFTIDRVEDLVFEWIEDITGIERAQVRRTDRLIDDLRMDGDGFSFVFVPRIEAQLGVRTTQADWANAYTVQDVINVFANKLSPSREHRSVPE